MNMKSAVKRSMIATVYRARTTTSPISKASLTWGTILRAIKLFRGW